MAGRAHLVTGTALVLLAVVPWASSWMESSLMRHLLIQYPLLIGGGALIGIATARRSGPRPEAVAALIAATCALGFWLLPRWIDRAVEDPLVDAAKMACLVAFAGVPLGLGWAAAGQIVRGFAWAHAVAMLGVMGWLQLSIPTRLCNSYLLSDQRSLGLTYLALSTALLVSGTLWALVGRPRPSRPYARRQQLQVNPGD